MIRLLICDDSSEARTLVRAVLAGNPEIEVVGEASNGREAVSLAEQLEPDVVLMDIAMPDLDGIEATRQIRAKHPNTRVVALTGLDDEPSTQAMLEAGAASFVVKGAPLWEIERAIQGVNQPLLRLAHTLARTLGERSAVGFIARETAELTGASVAGVFLGNDKQLAAAAFWGPSGADPLPVQWSEAVPSVVQKAHEGSRAAWADGRELIEVYRTYGAPCSSALSVPLLADGERLGVLLIVMPANVQFDLDVELVGALADIASGDLAGRRRLALSQAEARRDALTGLANRRAFDEHFQKLLEEAADRGESVSLVLLDLDEFKQINDVNGHSEGDRALVEVARLLQAETRGDEHVFRIGGDEFAVVVHGDTAAGVQTAERLLKRLRGRRETHGLPTLSAGVASFPVHAGEREELVENADAALYAAKRAGRDRVVTFKPGRATEEVPEEVPALRAVEPVSIVPDVEAASLMHDRRGPLRLLIVDDHPNLRMLLRTTFEIIDIEVDEAGTSAEATRCIADRPPDVIVLDVALPDEDGIAACRRLKKDPATSDIPIVLLTGAGASEDDARAAGADAFVRKPFSPLELLETIEQLAGGLSEGPFRLMTDERPEEQLLLYAQDLRRLLELERSQRLLIQSAYEETVTALARALESKDIGTGAHSMRVTRYASHLAQAVDPTLLGDQSLEYGFLLHDIGKIGIPDSLLQKRGPLSDAERRLLETHTILGQQILQRVPLLQGEGLRIIRSHHERWDGKGYPDGLKAEEIPTGARIFSIADTLDAMTTDRPYRKAGAWHTAVQEIVGEAGTQFDPTIVRTFEQCEPQLRRIYFELGAA